MQELESTPAETPEVETPKISLADLLADETPEPQKDSTEGKPAGDSPAKGKPKSLKELAERLELEDADLYGIQVPFADGESRTIGEIKDLVSKQDEFSTRELEFEESRSRQEGELLRARSELRELLEKLPPGAVKKEVLEEIREQQEAVMQRERAKTLDVIPEWRDEKTREKEIAGIVGYLQENGLPPSYLATVNDHRVIRMIREGWRREQHIRRALEQVKAASPAKTSKSKPAGAPKPAVSIPKNSRNPLADFLAD